VTTAENIPEVPAEISATTKSLLVGLARSGFGFGEILEVARLSNPNEMLLEASRKQSNRLDLLDDSNRREDEI
jgi:hypothetical protein